MARFRVRQFALPVVLWTTLAVPAASAVSKPKKDNHPVPQPSPMEQYIHDATQRSAAERPSPGSLYSPNARFADTARDLRASQVDDLVTIQVLDRASALAKGVTNSSRKSSAKATIPALAGVTRAAGPWTNLANLTGDQQLQGQGETSRESALTTTLSARVIQVLPNGYLVVEGVKDISVNSERQWVSVRGVVRPTDLNTDNSVASDRIANLEIRVNGKGVVADAVKRPFILYRILLGLLPF